MPLIDSIDVPPAGSVTLVTTGETLRILHARVNADVLVLLSYSYSRPLGSGRVGVPTIEQSLRSTSNALAIEAAKGDLTGIQAGIHLRRLSGLLRDVACHSKASRAQRSCATSTLVAVTHLRAVAGFLD